MRATVSDESMKLERLAQFSFRFCTCRYVHVFQGRTRALKIMFDWWELESPIISSMSHRTSRGDLEKGSSTGVCTCPIRSHKNI